MIRKNALAVIKGSADKCGCQFRLPLCTDVGAVKVVEALGFEDVFQSEQKRQVRVVVTVVLSGKCHQREMRSETHTCIPQEAERDKIA